jgi:peroxiredoxin
VKKKQFIIIAVSLSLLSVVWVLLTPLLFPVQQAEVSQTAPHRGFYAPGFTLETPQGESFSLSDYHGQPVLIFFWASWCSICKAAMPGLDAVYRDFAPQGFTILAVNTTYQDTLSSAVNHFQAQQFAYTLLLDRDGAVSAEYRVRAVPTSLLIGPDGIVTDVIIGSGISEGFLRARVNALLAEGEE